MPIFDEQWFIDLMKRAAFEHRYRGDLAIKYNKHTIAIDEYEICVHACKTATKATYALIEKTKQEIAAKKNS